MQSFRYSLADAFIHCPFIEFTGMINPRFHPLLTMVNRITGWPHMEDGEDPVDSRLIEESREAETESAETESPEPDTEKPETTDEDKAA